MGVISNKETGSGGQQLPSHEVGLGLGDPKGHASASFPSGRTQHRPRLTCALSIGGKVNAHAG